jgi:hypothetical protein
MVLHFFKKYTCGLFCLLLFFTNTKLVAQSSRYNWGFGIYPSAFNFFSLNQKPFDFSQYEYGLHLALNRYINKTFDWGVGSSFAVVTIPKDSIDGTNGKSRFNFYDASLSMRFKFANGRMLKEKALIAPFLRGAVGANRTTSKQSVGLFGSIGLGFNIYLDKPRSIALALQSVYAYGVIPAGNYLQHSVSMTFLFGKTNREEELDYTKRSKRRKDSDGDGVYDTFDKCPEVAGLSAANGCPDRDGDKVPDHKDECPDEKGFANLHGCGDRDGDGIADPYDICPDQYGKNADGCPNAGGTDKDSDGVPDKEDDCPTVKGFFTAKGCPDEDGDGVKDEIDECPKVYGAKDNKGCPK